ncbi:MAG: winged helix-turn-helix transcriptional regulator [Thermoplasmata archaeon]
MERHTKPFCSFQPLIEILGRKHALAILYAVFTKNPIRFTDLRKRTGVNPRTLTDRLRELERAGIISREAYNEIPPRVEYTLTGRGLALARIFESLEKWHEEYG